MLTGSLAMVKLVQVVVVAVIRSVRVAFVMLFEAKKVYVPIQLRQLVVV
jgi:hypothetical protein